MMQRFLGVVLMCILGGRAVNAPSIQVIQVDSAAASYDPLTPNKNVAAAQFGAICDGNADDTTSIQAAIDFARSNYFGNNIHHRQLVLPSGACRVTKPLDVTVRNWPDGALCVIGAGGRGQSLDNGSNSNTTVVDELTEPYPVFDFGGDTNGCIENLTIVAAPGTKSTGAIFVSAGSTRNIEGGQHFRIRDIQVVGSGHCPGCASVALPGVDEESIEDSQFSDGLVLGWGLGKSTAIESKFYDIRKILPNANTTRVTLVNVNSCADYVPAVQLTGSASYTGIGVYACLAGRGVARKIVEITSAPRVRGVAMNALHLNVRTENESGNAERGTCTANPSAEGCGATAIMIGSRVGGGELTGETCSDPSGSMIGTEGPPNQVEMLSLRLLCGASKAFHVTARWTFSNVDISLGEGTPSIGYIDPQSSWRSVDLHLPSSFGRTPSSMAYKMFPAGSSVTVHPF